MPVILFGLLIAFLITIIFEWGMDYLGLSSGRSNDIGSVEGRKITYQEFSDLVKNASDAQKQQTGAEPDENAQKQIRQQVWDQFVTQTLVEREIKKLGLMVPDQEIADWVRGENPPEDLKRNFIDSTGNFRRDLYDQFLANPNQFIREEGNPTAGTAWLVNYEKNLRQRRLSEKLQSIITASVHVSECEIKRRFADQSVKYDALFAFLDPNAFVKDEEVSVTDDDVKAFYQENLDQYKVEASRKLKYVAFYENPSAGDSAEAKSSIEEDAKSATGGADFIMLTLERSEKPDSGTWFKHGELGPDIEAAVFSAKVGDVVGPLTQPDGYHLMKVLEERKGTTEFVKASHILIQIPAGPDSVQAKATAAEVAKLAKSGKDFAELASKYSKDPSNAQKGGDLGWFSKGRMVKEFENATFNARVGEVVGPVRTAFGFHIIKVTGKDARELKVSRIISKIIASPQTRNDVYERSKDFAVIARESEFTKEAKSINVEPREAEVQEKGGMIPGLGMNESAVKWAFKGKVGEVSEPYSIPNGWAVFTVVEAKDAGVRSFDELKDALKPQALRKKKTEKTKEIASQLRSKLAAGDSLTKLSTLDTRLHVQRTGDFVMSGGVPGVGRDMNFFGAAEALKPGEISQPVGSTRGVYLIQLIARGTLDSTAYAAQRETLQSQMLQEKRNRYIGEWLTKMKESADIEDNRDIFYR
ncbi:MAG: peptidylprolyl isomerase [Ignavibacteriae bacterium]|nr:peptidylprolyl isomerase [Ignavibacteriota bacterium]